MNTLTPATSSPRLLAALIWKDWYLTRKLLIGLMVAGLIAVALIASASKGNQYAGNVLLITVLIAIGVHAPITTIVQERKSHTGTFIMTLPISLRTYQLSKLLANLLLMLLPSLLLMLSCFAAILLMPALPDGLLPVSAAVLGYIITGSMVILCVALLSEAMEWTVGVMITSNLLLQAMLYFVGNLPTTQATAGTDQIVWDSGIVTALLIEATICVMLPALTLWWKTRHPSQD